MSVVDSPMAVDSQLSDDDADTQSLSPSITDYPTHWGRRYHKFKEGSYLFPNDEAESERLDSMHHILTRLQGGKLFYAPVRDPKKILDVGTGTGIWPIELSDLEIFPNARIIGIDLSPIQPTSVPANVSFEIQDCSETDWRRPSGSIDYIHSRLMMGSLASFQKFVRTARRYLRPGTGWLECHELFSPPCSDDNSIPPDWPVSDWESHLHRASIRMDPSRPIRIADNIKPWMEQAGFVDIQEFVCKLPINSWPKDKELKKIGRYWADNILDGLPGISYKLLGPDGMGWSRTEIEVYLTTVRKALADRDVHAYQKVYIVYGRRPSAEEEKQRPAPVEKRAQNGLKGSTMSRA